MKVSEILQVKGSILYTISPDQPLADAANTMAEKDIGSLVVMEFGELAGMLTFREVLRAVGRAGSTWGDVAVSQVMKPDPMRTTPETQIAQLRREMLEKHQRYIPVMDGDTLLGVLSFHDVAKAILEEQGFENKMLKSYIQDWPTDVGPAA